jgi:hypothetical protein
MRSVLLFSGGMDSYAARMLYEPDVLLYVDAGTRYADAELRRLPEETIVVDMRVLNTFGVVDDIIPLRNLFFVAVAEMTYQVTKTYGHELGLSCVFRQHRANTHCKHLHGYALAFDIVFEAKHLTHAIGLLTLVR